VKKTPDATILGPLGPRAPPHCGVCGVSSYATGSLRSTGSNRLLVT